MHENNINTAKASHSRCFICNRQKVPLFVVKSDCMRFAYSNNRIIIKKHARLCKRHLDKNGKIKKDHFSLIPARPQVYDSTIVSLLDSLSTYSNNCNIFDQFRDCDFLDEEIFVKITGWTKSQFMVLSRFIVSIRDTNGRFEEQLLAIYFYWLRKGIDQVSLAMFKSNCNQRDFALLRTNTESHLQRFCTIFPWCEKPRS